LEFHPAVTFFIGENGAGKSTLLEAVAVACGFNAEGGSKNFRFGTRESHSELHRFLRVSRGHPRPRDGFFFRAESFFNVATEETSSALLDLVLRLRQSHSSFLHATFSILSPVA